MSRQNYLIAALIIFITEVLIALFVHDDLIRPWGGDVLVVVLLYCLVRGVTTMNVQAAAVSVLMFACLIEALQYLQMIKMLGLEDKVAARTIIGTTFSWSDIAAYTLGIVFVVGMEVMFDKKRVL